MLGRTLPLEHTDKSLERVPDARESRLYGQAHDQLTTTNSPEQTSPSLHARAKAPRARLLAKLTAFNHSLCTKGLTERSPTSGAFQGVGQVTSVCTDRSHVIDFLSIIIF